MRKRVTICLETLFNHLAKGNEACVATCYGRIQKETADGKKYYDFKNDRGTPCMDGETCEVICEFTGEKERYVMLREIDEKIPFKLSKEEFEIAAIEL